MTATEPWGPGHVIAGKFRLIEQLGRGGMGSVWAAHHLALNSRVAVKIIDPAIATKQEALERFMREAQAAAALRSPHVVNTFDYGVDGGVPFIAMELLEGRTLAELLEKEGPLSLEKTSAILTQVCRAITKAHDMGIVHRDLKPDNIFLVTNDDEEIAKVLDFGIAKTMGNSLGVSSQTRTGAVMGTPYYMSPEQVEGNRRVDHRADLWALSVIAFECATGRRPFESEALGDLILQICARPIRRPSSVLATIPESFDRFFLKGTERDPALRYQSARELANALRTAAGVRASVADTSQVRSDVPGGGPSLGTAAASSPFASTPDPLNATTGGAGSVVRASSAPRRSRTPLIVGVAFATIGVAAGLGVVLLRRGGPAEAHSAAAPAAAEAVSAPTVASPAPLPSAAPEPSPSGSPEPEAPGAADAVASAAAPDPSAPAAAPDPSASATPPSQPVAAKKPSAPRPPAAGKKKPAPRPRMDFGF